MPMTGKRGFVSRAADQAIALPCGSTSTSSARLPAAMANTAAMLTATVVLPTPPFWLTTPMIIGPALPPANRYDFTMIRFCDLTTGCRRLFGLSRLDAFVECARPVHPIGRSHRRSDVLGDGGNQSIALRPENHSFSMATTLRTACSHSMSP
jgi:hypothetical protein